MSKEEILTSAISELRGLAKSAGKTLNEKSLKALFIRKKAYQKDWPQAVLRKKATLIAGATVLAIGEMTEQELIGLI
jgi:hypothetical protein